MGFVHSIFQALKFNRRNWKAVALSVVAAVLFWIFNAMNKTHTANINFPLHFEYDHEKFVPVNPLPDHIRMNVTGIGWELLRKNSGLKVAPLIITLERPAEVKKIVGASLTPLFSSQTENLQINYVLADTLYIDIDRLVQRKIRVKLDSTYRFVAPGYLPSGNAILQPDTIVVQGPAKIVASLPDFIEPELPERNLRSSFSDEVGLVPPHPSLAFVPSQVAVTLPVERAQAGYPGASHHSGKSSGRIYPPSGN
ncbi:MAG: hypothetical protein KatS3mg032_0802 [Cyclobacteriaceae bacterium]|nr:MAG: hypothetical protein KatS3mg032_0802 [Cyclobacteriaceae bacterium]